MANRAVVVTDLRGDPQKAWRLENLEKPSASPGHVVVRMILRPVNPTDIIATQNFLGRFQGKKDVVIGSEGVGYVEEVGEGVTKVKVGQRVAPSFLKEVHMKGNGSWVDYAEIPEEDVYLVPDSLSDEVAAIVIINLFTLYSLFLDMKVPKGEYILQTGAASVMGRQVIQLAKHWGIKTISVVRRDDVKEELKSLGADEVINSCTEDLVARVKDITGGKGVYGAFDSVAGSLTKDVASSVRDGGNIFVYGYMGTQDFTVTLSLFDTARVHVKMWDMQPFSKTREDMQKMWDDVTKLLEEKVIVPLVGKTYKLEDFKQALLEANKSSRSGKVYLAN